MTFRNHIAIPLLVLAAAASYAAATEPSDPAVTPETAKLIAEDALVVDPGQVELEFGYAYVRGDRAFDAGGDLQRRGEVSGYIPSFRGRFGIRDNLDVGFEVTYRTITVDEDDVVADRLGILLAGIKWVIHRSVREDRFFSLVPRFSAPFGARGEDRELAPGQDYWSVGGVFVYTAIGDRYNVSVDLGYDAAVGGKRADNQGALVLDFAWGYQATRRIQPEIEINYVNGLVVRAPNAEGLGITAGLILNLTPSIRLDLGFQRIVRGRITSEASAFLSNLSWTF